MKIIRVPRAKKNPSNCDQNAFQIGRLFISDEVIAERHQDELVIIKVVTFCFAAS